MSSYGDDIYTDPAGINPDTLAALGPLAPMAGVWEGMRGVDVAPKAAGPRTQEYYERIELQPVDPGNNGPQLLYALRYHTWMCKPGESATYHDQVGYWLWEPATQTVMHSLTIPRGQTVLAAGQASGAQVAYHGADMSRAADIEDMMRYASAEFGRVDILVNNAGILRDRMFHAMSAEEFDAVVKVHLYGTFYMSRAAAPHFKRLRLAGPRIHHFPPQFSFADRFEARLVIQQRVHEVEFE